MDSLKNSLFGAIQRTLSKSSVCVRLAVKLRNQLNGIIGFSLNDGIDMSSNGESWLINQVAPKARVFIDVGANAGAWSKIFISKMSHSGRGLLFEPSPLALGCLVENFQKEISENLVEIVPAAVCEHAGAMDFYMEEAAGETSSLIAAHSNDSARKIKVTTTTIDAEVASRGLLFIDFLKVDAEGYDLQVLRGAINCLRSQSVGVIQFEYNAPWTSSSATLLNAIGYLQGFGYTVYLLKRNGLYEFNYALYGEFFHYSNFVAIAPGYLEVIPLPL